MLCTNLASALLLLLLPEVVLPRPAELLAAAGDPVELERLSTRLGPARLSVLLDGAANHGQTRLSLAALRGAGLMGDAHPELAAQALLPMAETLYRLGRSRHLDERLSVAAGDALRHLGRAVGGSMSCGESDDSGCGAALSDAARRLFALVHDSAQPMPLREASLDSLVSLPLPLWQPLLPSIRKLAEGTASGPTSGPATPNPAAPPTIFPQKTAMAALAVLWQRDQPNPLLELSRSSDGNVASLAIAELCPLLTPHKAVKGAGAAATAAPAFPEDLTNRARALAAPTEPLPQRQRLADCLKLFGTPADRALLQNLATAKGKGHR